MVPGETIRHALPTVPNSNGLFFFLVGEHGYNNSLTDMHPYFIGYGPAFKKGYNITQFMNLDIYPLMCNILGITPAPNNGSFDRVKSILKNEGKPIRTRIFGNGKNRPAKFEQMPPWVARYEEKNMETTPDFDIKAVQHYLPFSYSQSNFSSMTIFRLKKTLS